MDENKHPHKHDENCDCGRNHEHEHDENCSCGHDHYHGHSHEEIFGAKDEIPGVFSHSIEMNLENKITAEELKEALTKWIEGLKNWVSTNKYYIGHVKVFAGSDDVNLWLSTTGRQINVKTSENSTDKIMDKFTINITAIIFGAQEKALKDEAIKGLEEIFKYKLSGENNESSK
ncbi:hypothetical protein OXPF_42710 [Oxobacter pfennigii]|uniref:Uncharacterized protein n=1 Tax=Oxobacter pfennigii TaxID=36849 RepID=A0A0P8W4Q5_9CLOT|nr:hypothetical protein [Oxobacter pfennigii]KPU42486.1 hypothetical protein OXPF_42710 [Oxobacter pfennigii]